MILLVFNLDVDFMGDGRRKSEKNISYVFKLFKEVESGLGG